MRGGTEEEIPHTLARTQARKSERGTALQPKLKSLFIFMYIYFIYFILYL